MREKVWTPWSRPWTGSELSFLNGTCQNQNIRSTCRYQPFKTHDDDDDDDVVVFLTVFISVDSAFPTRTKTSASKQNLSIQLSNSRVTSVPGLPGVRGQS